MDNLNNTVKKYNKLFYVSGPVSFYDYIDNKYNIIHEQLYNDALDLYLNSYFGTAKEDILKDYKFIEIKDKEYYNPSYVIQIKTNVNYSYFYDKMKEYLTSNYSELDFSNYSYSFIKNEYENPTNNYVYDNNSYTIYVKPQKKEVLSYSYIYTYWSDIKNMFGDQIQKIDLTPYWNNYQKDTKINKEYDKLNINKETLKTAKIVYINFIKGKIKLRSRYTDEEFEIDFNTYNENLEKDEDMKLTYTFTNLRNKY